MNFTDNHATKLQKDKFLSVTLDMKCVLKSWKKSLFSFEWMDENGQIKDKNDLPPSAQEKRQKIEDKIRRGDDLEKPILGIGLLEHIEIGTGKEILLTLAAQGIKEIPVHIPKNNKEEFESFLV